MQFSRNVASGTHYPHYLFSNQPTHHVQPSEILLPAVTTDTSSPPAATNPRTIHAQPPPHPALPPPGRRHVSSARTGHHQARGPGPRLAAARRRPSSGGPGTRRASVEHRKLVRYGRH